MSKTVTQPLRDEWRLIKDRLKLNPSYHAISKALARQIIPTTGTPFMNHIHEGVYVIVRRYGWLDSAITAYCVHPIFQSDTHLEKAMNEGFNLATLSREVIILAMEYRKVVSSKPLSERIRDQSHIQKSPLEGVNQMLVADSIQNKKEFLNQADNAKEDPKPYLAYFDQWLAVLGVPQDEYEKFESELNEIF